MNGSKVPARQIVLAYALLVSLLVSVWSSLAQPAWDEYKDRQNSIEAQRLRLQRLEHAVATDLALDGPASRTLIDGLQGYIEESSLAAQTADIGASLLQQRLSRIVESHRGEAGHTRISGGSDPSQVNVSMHFTIDLTGLKGVLYELAGARPFIFTDVLSIRIPDTYGASTVESTGSQPLAVQIDASTFWIDSSTVSTGS